MSKETSNKAISQWGLMWRKFKRNHLAWVGIVIVGMFLIVSLFAPFFSPSDPTNQTLRRAHVQPQRIHFFDTEGDFHFRPFVYKLEKGVDPVTFVPKYKEDKSKKLTINFFINSWEYKFLGVFKTNLHFFGVEKDGEFFLFGTDLQGRDLFSRIVHGGRVSLIVALLSAIATVVIGSIMGGISGYFGGVIDLFLQRIVEFMQCFPRLPLWMVLSVAIPTRWPPQYILFGIVGIFALISWPAFSREIRGKVLSYRDQDYVLAAKSVGASDMRIIITHVLPQTLSHIITVFTIIIPAFILAESAMSFLGLGIQPPMVSWGVLLKKAQNLQVLGQYPWVMIPGVFILLAVLGFNFLGDGLRDAADPFSQ